MKSSSQRPELILASQWRQIVNGAIDTAIISTDSNGCVTSWNRGAELILGWSEDEMLGQTLDCVFPQEGQFGREMLDAVDTGPGGGEEGWRIRKDGSRFWAVGELTPIRQEGREALGFIKILRDRTSQRAAEQNLRDEHHALEILNRALSAISVENDSKRVVQIVTDAGVELTSAEFGAFFYNLVDERGESYLLYTLSGVAPDTFAKFPMPRNTQVFAPTFSGTAIVRSGDITQDPRYGHMEPHRGMPAGHLPVRSYLAVPVTSRTGSAIGGLFFGHSHPDVFTERSERWLVGLAA